MGNFPKEMSGSTHGQTIKNKIKNKVIEICFMRMGGYISSRGARVVLQLIRTTLQFFCSTPQLNA
jgi:hypothetical protein